jgi:hypothetical protein
MNRHEETLQAIVQDLAPVISEKINSDIDPLRISENIAVSIAVTLKIPMEANFGVVWIYWNIMPVKYLNQVSACIGEVIRILNLSTSKVSDDHVMLIADNVAIEYSR